MKSIMRLIALITGICAILFTIYWFFWIGKKISYELMYEGMVRSTIEQMVEPSALKED